MNCNCSRISLHQFQFQYIPKAFPHSTYPIVSAVFHLTPAQKWLWQRSQSPGAVSEFGPGCTPRRSTWFVPRLRRSTSRWGQWNQSPHSPRAVVQCPKVVRWACLVATNPKTFKVDSKSSEVGDYSSHKKERNSSASRLNHVESDYDLKTNPSECESKAHFCIEKQVQKPLNIRASGKTNTVY